MAWSREWAERHRRKVRQGTFITGVFAVACLVNAGSILAVALSGSYWGIAIPAVCLAYLSYLARETWRERRRDREWADGYAETERMARFRLDRDRTRTRQHSGPFPK